MISDHYHTLNLVCARHRKRQEGLNFQNLTCLFKYNIVVLEIVVVKGVSFQRSMSAGHCNYFCLVANHKVAPFFLVPEKLKGPNLFQAFENSPDDFFLRL